MTSTPIIFLLLIVGTSYAATKPGGGVAKGAGAYASAKGGQEMIAALRSIWELGPAYLDELKACVGDDSLDEKVRDACLVGVGKVLKDKDGEFYLPLIEKPGKTHVDDHLRIRAAELLSTRTPESKALLKRVLEDPASSRDLKTGAAMGLANMGDGSGAEHALQQILSGNENYRPVAVLTQLKDKSGVPRIKEAMEGRSAYDAEKLRKVIVQLESAGEDEDDRVKRLERAIEESDPASQVPRDLCQELLRMRTTKAYQALDRLTHSKNKTVSFESTFALQNPILRMELSIAEVKAAIGNTELMKTTQKALDMMKGEAQERGRGK